MVSSNLFMICVRLSLMRCQRYGDYTKHPFEPYVGSDKYDAVRYDSWDPNWRGFIGTTFVLALEEYSGLINEDTQGLMMESLYNCSVGDSYRFGSREPGGDNLWPAYSNPVCPCHTGLILRLN